MAANKSCQIALPAIVLLLLNSCVAITYVPTRQQEEEQREELQGDSDKALTVESTDSALLQLSWDRDTQLIDRERSISGLRLGLLVSENKHMDGLDLNLGGGISHGGNGIQISLVGNGVYHRYNGIQIAGLTNWMFGDEGTAGIQIALFLNRQPYGTATGLKLALFNVHGHQVGAQIGVLNAADDSCGIQAGLFNGAGGSSGLQIAVGNWSDTNSSLQVGLANRTKSGLQFGLINFNENGFLPVFPFFNF